MVYDLVNCTRYSKKRLHSLAYMLRVLWANAERMSEDVDWLLLGFYPSIGGAILFVRSGLSGPDAG